MSEEKKIQQDKLEAVSALKDILSVSQEYIFTDYRGLTVEQITAIRNTLREKKAVYKVIKNRFAKIVLKDLGCPELGDNLVGPTAVAIATDEAGPIAKDLLEFAKDAPLEIKGGYISGNVFDFDQIEAFSKLPTRLELIGKLMGTMNAPVQNMVYVMNGVVTKLARTLQAVAESKAS